MNLCGWFKIFKRKNAVNASDADSESGGPDGASSKNAERRTASSKGAKSGGKSKDGGSRNGTERNVGGSAESKTKVKSDGSVSEDDWGASETERDADAGSDEGNPRNKTALKPGHSLMHWIRLGNSGVDLAGTGGKVRPVNYGELAKHNKPDDIWMAIRGKVYNVTRYLDFHPGGIDELMRGAGRDATKLFDEVHAFVNYESLLAKCYIGPLRSTGVLHLVPEEPAEVSFLKPPTPSNPSVIITPSSPSIHTLKASSANSIVSSSSEESASTAPPIVPRFDWIQKTAEVTFIFYTKALCNPAVVVELVNNLEFNVRLFLEGNVCHRYQFQVANNLQWPCTVRQSLEAGKVELVFNKLLLGLWTSYGQMEHERSENYPLELYEYDVATRIEITHDSCALLLRPKNNSILQVVPIGHHLSISGTVADGQVVTRSYTPVPASAIPTDCPPTFVPLLVKTYQHGSLSKYLTRPAPLATSLQLSQPSGSFSLAKLKHHNRIALLAAGSGITPMLALLNYLLERSSNKMESVSLLYFNKTEADIWCREMLDNLCAKDKRLTVKHFLSEAESQSATGSPTTSRPPSSSSPPAASSSSSMTTTGAESRPPSRAALEHGRISLAVTQQLTNVDSPLSATFVCLCGPKPFNELSLQHLEQAGFNMAHVHSFQG